MSYHPIMGIMIFILTILLSFLIGKKYILAKQKYIHKSKLKKKKIVQDSISPDASWLD